MSSLRLLSDDYMDFTINASLLDGQRMSILVPYKWEFLDYSPGSWLVEVVTILTPFDWSSTDMERNSSWLYSNMTFDTVSVNLSSVVFEESCEISNDTPSIITNSGQLNCSSCVELNNEYSITDAVTVHLVQYGAALDCSSTDVLPSLDGYTAGEEVTFNFTISHNPFSTESASILKVEVDVGNHAQVISMQAFLSDANGSVSLSPVVGTNAWVIDVSNFTEASSMLISTSAVFKDTLPLDDRRQYMTLRLDWTSDSANGLFLTNYCNTWYKTDVASLNANGSYLNIPEVWNVGQEAEAIATITLPPGTVDEVFMRLEFESDQSEVGLEMVESTVETSHPLVVVSHPRRIVYRRKKRSVSYQTISIGPITNPANPGGPATVVVAAKFRPTFTSPPSASINTSASLIYAGVTTPFGSFSSSTASPLLTFSKITQQIDTQTILVNITGYHAANSTGAAVDVNLADAEDGFTIVGSTVAKGGFGWNAVAGDQIIFTGEGSILFKMSQFSLTTDPFILTYRAVSRGDGFFPHGTHNNTASLQWKSALAGPVIDSLYSYSCTNRNDIYEESFLYKHGITAGVIIAGFFLGIILVPIIIAIVVLILKKTRPGFGTSIQPSATDYGMMSKQTNNNLLLDADQKLKQGLNSAMVDVDDSIVAVLSLRDKFTTNRELDNLDIQGTVEVDKRMEEERLKSMYSVLTSLLLSMVKNGDITKQQYEQTIILLQRSSKELDVKLSMEYSVAITEFTQRQAMHNRSALGNLIDKQREVKHAQLAKVSGMSEEDRQELVQQIDAQCQIEQDDLSYRLKLEQDEETEKLRKEFSLKKRIQTKEIQQNVLNDLKTKSNMPEKQAAWLLKEHAQNVHKLERIHDDELCRQKLVLEEKLAKRRALAELSDLQERGQSDLLNTIAGGQMDILKKAKKHKVLSADEARAMSDDIMRELMTYKQSMEEDISKQESALHKRLSEAKKKKLAAKAKEHEKELADFDKEYQQHQMTAAPLSPIAVAERRLQIVAEQEIDLADTEIQVDQENATELTELRDQMSQTYKGKLLERERKLLDELKDDGLNDDQVQAILHEHSSNVDNLESKQNHQYKQQDENLKMKLKKRRRDWEKRMEEEKAEKAQLREQENAVVGQIIDSQFTMSADEREKIMREHEKDMMRLENSLTLNKLKQRQILEEKLAERKAKRLQALEVSQTAAVKKTEKKYANEDEDDQQTAALELLKTQAEERVAMLTDEDTEINLDEEMEKVKLEMLQQRAAALREQEDRLGSMVAQLQINKAKELTEIDEKQRAINELKANLIDDLSERGVMSDGEAEMCLEQHKAQQTKLTNKLNNEREKQERMLKKKLADRLGAREKTLMDSYEDRLKEVIDQTPKNKLAAKLKKAAILHKRATAIEEFKLRMEKEISQSLEEMRREHSVKKAKLMQELELRFIASLVRTDKQLESLINTLHDPTATVAEEENDLLDGGSASMLKERIARSVSMYQKEHPGVIQEEPLTMNSRPKSMRKKQSLPPLDFDRQQGLPALRSAGLRGRRPLPSSEHF
ncbi:limbin-like [Watersipora subatra]|uniref:limbin-like n=1 Tax=Watersipora subatra TaxID=2589382 RepID=UPI00355B5A3D